jgi:Ca2+-binding EF-hand superfamily protein
MKKQYIAAILFFFPAMALAVVAPEFKDVDANGDGVLSEQEFSAALSGIIDFKSADQNSDGVVDKEEYAMVKRAIEAG